MKERRQWRQCGNRRERLLRTVQLSLHLFLFCCCTRRVLCLSWAPFPLCKYSSLNPIFGPHHNPVSFFEISFLFNAKRFSRRRSSFFSFYGYCIIKMPRFDVVQVGVRLFFTGKKKKKKKNSFGNKPWWPSSEWLTLSFSLLTGQQMNLVSVVVGQRKYTAHTQVLCEWLLVVQISKFGSLAKAETHLHGRSTCFF